MDKATTHLPKNVKQFISLRVMRLTKPCTEWEKVGSRFLWKEVLQGLSEVPKAEHSKSISSGCMVTKRAIAAGSYLIPTSQVHNLIGDKFQAYVIVANHHPTSTSSEEEDAATAKNIMLTVEVCAESESGLLDDSTRTLLYQSPHLVSLSPGKFHDAVISLPLSRASVYHLECKVLGGCAGQAALLPSDPLESIASALLPELSSLEVSPPSTVKSLITQLYKIKVNKAFEVSWRWASLRDNSSGRVVEVAVTASTQENLRLISVDIPTTTNSIVVTPVRGPSGPPEDPSLSLMKTGDTKRFLFQVRWCFSEVTQMPLDETALLSMGSVHWGDILITYRQGTAYSLGQYLAAQLIWPLSDVQTVPPFPLCPISYHFEIDKEVNFGKPSALCARGSSMAPDLEMVIEACVSDDFIVLGTFPINIKTRPEWAVTLSVLPRRIGWLRTPQLLMRFPTFSWRGTVSADRVVHCTQSDPAL